MLPEVANAPKEVLPSGAEVQDIGLNGFLVWTGETMVQLGGSEDHDLLRIAVTALRSVADDPSGAEPIGRSGPPDFTACTE